MFIILNHDTGRTSTAPTLQDAHARMRHLRNSVACDENGVVRARTRGGHFTPLSPNGFPPKAARA